MQVLVMYHSRTGNTENLAKTISNGVKQVDGVNCLLKSVDEVTEADFLNSQGIIVGSPVYFGLMSAEVKKVFDKFVGLRGRTADKIGAAFVTAAEGSAGEETAVLSILQVMLMYGMIIVGDPMEASGHYGLSCVGLPGKDCSGKAALLGKRVAELVKKIKG